MSNRTQQTLSSNHIIPDLNIDAFQFLKKIIEAFSMKEKVRHSNIAFVVVSHSYESVLPMLQSLPSIGEVLAIIPKDSTKIRYYDIIDALKADNFNIIEPINKENFKSSKFTIELLKKLHCDNKKFIILDHGGYFAEVIHSIVDAFKENLVGIAEFTYNGQKRYETFSNNLSIPIITCARSPLKQPADKEAGESIAHLIDHVLRITWGIKSKTKNKVKIGIIGYGILGGAVAKSLRARGARNILIADNNYLQLLSAVEQRFEISSTECIIKNCNLIVSATSNKGIAPEEYVNMRDGAFIATVTSPDDELDLDHLIDNQILIKTNETPLVTTFHVNNTEKEIHLIAEGNSANTLIRAGIGSPSLFLIEAEYLVSILLLITSLETLKPNLQEVSSDIRSKITSLWLEHFHYYVGNEGLKN
jgi:adenosylhomocysteinase